MKTFSRRDFLKVTGVGSASVAAALALTACSSNNNAGNESSTANESSTTNNSGSESSAGNTTQIEDVTEAAQNVSEEESDILDAIVVGSGGFYTSLTPVRNGNYQWNVFVRYLFDRVIYRTGDRRYIGQGAKSWSVADDGVTYSVELYENITDSEGNAVTAEDVVWMIEESMAAKQKACYAKIDHVTLTGDYTFDVVMKMDMADPRRKSPEPFRNRYFRIAVRVADVQADAESGEALFLLNGYNELPVASLTKLLSYYILREGIDAGEIKNSDSVRISDHAYAVSKTQDGIVPMEAGAYVPFRELLDAMLVASVSEPATTRSVSRYASSAPSAMASFRISLA